MAGTTAAVPESKEPVAQPGLSLTAGSSVGSGSGSGSGSSSSDSGAAALALSVGGHQRQEITLAWKDVTYALPIEDAKTQTSWGAIQRPPPDPEAEKKPLLDPAPEQQQAPFRVVLNKVSGFCLPGTFTALLGSSGAGKTTLLNILSQRTHKKEFTGSVLLNGAPASAALLHQTAFVEQTDMFYVKLTVKEHLLIQARLRLPDDTPPAKLEARVDEVISELGLLPNAIIGVNGAGISGGERRRLTFAAELLTDPSLLFLDEPTSGLDSTMAGEVLRKLSDLAKGKKDAKGNQIEPRRTVICTVHQPDPFIFTLFDNVMVMAEGEVAYFGPAKDLEEYTRVTLNQAMPTGPGTDGNVAAHMIQLISVGAKNRTLDDVKAFLAIFQSSKQKEVMDKLQEADTKTWQDKNRKNPPPPDHDADEVSYRSSWCTQFGALCRRSWISLRRDQAYLSGRLTQQIVVNILLGLIALRMKNNQEMLSNKVGALFFIMWNTTFSSVWSVSVIFPNELPLFIREYKAGLYRADTFFLARNLVEMPAQIMFPLIYGTVSYWMCGFNDNGFSYLKYIFSLCFAANAAASLGYIISCIGGVRATADITPLILFPFLICGGLILSVQSIPLVFRWLVDISIFHDAFELMCISIFRNYSVGCDSGEACTIKTGDQLLDSLGFSAANIFVILMRLLAYFVIFRVLAFGLLVLRGRARGSKN